MKKAARALQQTTTSAVHTNDFRELISVATGNGEEDYIHRYVHSPQSKIEVIVRTFILDEAMRMALTAKTMVCGLWTNPYRRIFYDNTAMPMELGARHIGMPYDAGAGPAKRP